MSLQRFHEAQADPHAGYDTALPEIRRGRKTSHWIWYIFPQLAGLGRSTMAERYAIRDLAEACGNLATFIVDLIGATSDTLNITGLLDLSGLFDALSFNGTPDGTSTYLLANFGSINGTFNTAPAFAGYQYIYGLTTLELSPLTPVPEPSTWVAGALALLAAGFTQRRRFVRKTALVRA